MKSLISLIRRAPWLFLASVSMSIVAAVLVLAVVSVLSAKIGAPQAPGVGLGGFSLLAVLTVGSGIAATLLVNRVSFKATQDLSYDLVTDILSSSLKEIERSGKTSVTAALVEDIPRVIELIPALVMGIRHIAFILCCLIYIGYLSMSLLGITVLFIVVAALAHLVLQRHGSRVMRAMGVSRESLLHIFRDIVDGIKQLKLSDNQRAVAVGSMREGAVELAGLHVRSAAYFIVGGNLVVMVFYALIAAAVFGALGGVQPTKVIAGYSLCVIMMLAPLQGVASAAQAVAHGFVAFARIERLRRTLHQANEDAANSRIRIVFPTSQATDSTRDLRLELREVRHTYESGTRDSFTLGPINLSLRAGEIAFIVGGNGSGKTTLAKLLTGLYVPAEGELLLDGLSITDSNRQLLRSKCCAVFSDFCLFESLARVQTSLFGKMTRELVRTVGLEHVVDTEAGLLEQVRTFSTGERRRFALLLSLLEDRPIYLFDEFAADQDPLAKELFYERVIPELSRRGKLVIAITHDTRYFHVADQVVTLERGIAPVIGRVGARSGGVKAGGSRQLVQEARSHDLG